jgi:hypothetical protein
MRFPYASLCLPWLGLGSYVWIPAKQPEYPINTTTSSSPLEPPTILLLSSVAPNPFYLTSPVAPSQLHHHVGYAANSLALGIITKLLLTQVQEVQDMTDTLPSSRTRAVSTKSVCRVIEDVELETLANNFTTRVRIQGHHRSQHHFSRRERQGLCCSHLAEESPSSLTLPPTWSTKRPLTFSLNRTSLSTLPPYPMSTNYLLRSAAS